MPNIVSVVRLVSQFMHYLREFHLQATQRILQYLKGAPRRGILYKMNEYAILEAYTDADYVGPVTDRRSTIGYCTFLGGNLVTWRSKKQNVMTWSSVEVEFQATAQGILTKRLHSSVFERIVCKLGMENIYSLA
ncbi:putative mitochondrial protein, partial [Mucuna pruriens]